MLQGHKTIFKMFLALSGDVTGIKAHTAVYQPLTYCGCTQNTIYACTVKAHINQVFGFYMYNFNYNVILSFEPWNQTVV